MHALLGIRHAESTMNAAGLWQGQADPPLSARGREQAAALARRLAREGPAPVAIATSDLARARQTAAILAACLGLEPRVHPGLREMDVGMWSGLSHAEIGARWPEAYARFRAGDAELRPGGGESRRELRARVQAALEELCADLSAGPLAVVTHAGVLHTVCPGRTVAHAEMVWIDSALALRETARPVPAGEAL